MQIKNGEEKSEMSNKTTACRDENGSPSTEDPYHLMTSSQAVKWYGSSVLGDPLSRDRGIEYRHLGNVPDPFLAVIKWRPDGSGLHLVWHARRSHTHAQRRIRKGRPFPFRLCISTMDYVRKDGLETRRPRCAMRVIKNGGPQVSNKVLM